VLRKIRYASISATEGGGPVLQRMNPDKLILFDYSGTLSLQAVLFGQRNSFQSALERSGLARLGVTPTFLWKKIINPTWREGSTTRVGYKQLLLRSLAEEAEFRNPGKKQVIDADLPKAVADFVNSYLASSCMEESWRPLLRKLPQRKDVCAVIVTDHYADATSAIVRYLAEWNIPALPAEKAFGFPRPAAIIVANSADLGAHKISSRFWQPLKSGLQLQDLEGILLIDDFGYNEQEGDAYSEREAVAIRQVETARLLQEVFQVAPCIFPFFLEREKGSESYGRLMIQAALVMDQFLDGKIG